MAMEMWRPMTEMRRLTEDMERLMTGTLAPFTGMAMGTFPINLYRKNNDLIVECPLPGVRPEDVDVSISGRMLTIRAERKETKETKQEDYYLREMSAGRIFRQIMLPSDVQADQAEATYENGVLQLRLPVAKTSKEVPVKVKHS